MKTNQTQSGSLAESVAADLRAKVTSGVYAPGTKLPGRRALSAEYQVAPITLDYALKALIQEGVLIAHHGRGIFVQSVPGLQAPSLALPQIGILARMRYHTNRLPYNLITAAVLISTERAITKGGGQTFFFNCIQDEVELPLTQALKTVLREGVDAIVVIEWMDGIQEAIELARQAKTPIVFVGSEPIPGASFAVYYNSHDAAQHATEHLLRQGWRDIVFFAPYRAEWVAERLNGVHATLRKHPLLLTSLQTLIREGDIPSLHNHEEVGYRYAREAISPAIVGKAVVAANDGVAAGFIRAASELGLRHGQDYAIIGFDDDPIARELQLTTLCQPTEELGREGARLALLSLDGKTTNAQISLQSQLIIRASTPVCGDNRQ